MIVPGSTNPLLMAQAGDPLDELGKIERAIRFRSSAGAVISRAVTVTGDRKKWKLVLDVKGAGLGTSYCLFDAYLDTQNFTRVYLLSSGAIQFDTSTGNVVVGQAIASRLMRDPAAHFELGITFDSANATAADRMIIEINGVRQSLSSYSAPAMNLDSWMNMSGTTLYFGRTGSTALYFDGYLSWPRLTDGQIPAASAYGVSHPRTSQWRPKWKSAIRAAVAAGGGARNGWGTNGFFLPFDDVTSLTTLCYDRSQSDTYTTGNNFTATNISLTSGTTFDSMLDTLTNNFCTLNPLLPINILTGGYYPILPTDGALKITGSASPPANYQVGTQQIKFKTAYAMLVGTVGSGTFYIGIQNVSSGQNYVYQQDGQKNLAGVASAYGAAFTAGDRVAVVVDPAARSLEFFKQTGGVGGFVSQGVIATAFPAGDYVPFFYASNGTVLTVDFGQQGFVPSSVSADAKALCTKNLPINHVGPMKSSNAFVAVTDSGANIVSALAAAAPWSDWIRIIKRRDSAEGWRWIFSDDPTNYLDTSTTNAKAALPAFAGSSYVGYALRVSAANGVATGTFVHANGVASVISDGLSNARKMVILHRESAGGGAFYAYHPDLTAGKLLYLNTTDAETTDASINTVTAGGFTAAAALPSGTYRWVSLAETDGFLRFGKYTGNGVMDGPFYGNFPSAFDMVKRFDVADGWFSFDAASNPRNPATFYLSENSPAGKSSSANYAPDLVSNGTKMRSISNSSNANGGIYGYVKIADFPFRYANAR